MGVELIEVHPAKVKGWVDELVFVDVERLSIVSYVGHGIADPAELRRLAAMGDTSKRMARDFLELAEQIEDGAVAA